MFEAVKPGIEGMIATGTALTAGTKASVYVLQKGAKLVSYLITPLKRKNKKAKTGSRKGKPASKVEEEPQITKSDVAIVIDINHRTLNQVAQYLEEQGIDADFIVITNDPDYSDHIRMLDWKKRKEWEAILRDFASTITKIEHKVGKAHVHIFQSVPLALSFGLGCVWGTVHPASVYHYERGIYSKVFDLDRMWKQG